MVLSDQCPADRTDGINPIDKLASLVTPHQNVKPVGLGIDKIGPLAGGRLHHHDPAHTLPFVVGVLNETVDKGAQR